jgi:hypothetical protein
MTTTMMEREELTQLIQVLPDKKVKAALDLIKNLEFEDDIDEHEPNAETAKVLRESEAGINVTGPFHNMNDFMTSLLSNNNA